MSHLERVLPVYEEWMRTVKAKYASKKKLWGRQCGSRQGSNTSYSSEQIGHMRWLNERHGSKAAREYAKKIGMNKYYVALIITYSTRSNVPAVRSLHEPDMT